MNVVQDYFTRHKHEHVVVYADFYSQAIERGLLIAGYSISTNPLFHRVEPGYVTFVNNVQFYSDYLDLLNPMRLDRLERAFQREGVKA
jgi:hypothetical protein